jgi:molybdate transport system substrate-binding protein
MRGLILGAIIVSTTVAAAAFWLVAPQVEAVAVVRVAAASDLRFALEDVLFAFRQRRPDIEITATYGSSGNFFAQISNDAPFDVFLSADMDYPRRLTESGLADNVFRYAIGHVVAWVPRASPLDLKALGDRAFLDPSVKTIAVANPKYAPYGRAALAALKSLGVYERVSERIVYGETVAQAAQFAQSGAADIGVIGKALALSPAMQEQGGYWEIPADAYPRIEQGGVILRRADDRAAAEAFRAFLVGADGQAILRRHGFTSPEP